MKSPRRSLRRFVRSKGGISQILAELMMVLIVLIMSVTVFVFYSGAFGALLGAVRLHPEDFTIVGAGTPASGAFNTSAVHPTPGGNPHFSTNGTPCTGTISTTAGNLYVPPGQSCTINGATVQSINVNFGATLIINGGNLQAVNDNYSSSITISNNALLQGGISLYGTRSFSMTSSHSSSGAVTMDGVLYATYSNNILGGTITMKNNGSLQLDGNTISGTLVYTNNQVVRLTNTIINGTLTFTDDSNPNCYVDPYTVSHTSGGPYTGICSGGSPSGALDILNTGSFTISFNALYLDGQQWSGVSWTLGSGTTEQCGGETIQGGPCTVMPIVVPPKTMVHVSFSWVNPTPTSPVEILMLTKEDNFLQSRVDPTAGLVCSTRSVYPPLEFKGFC